MTKTDSSGTRLRRTVEAVGVIAAILSLVFVGLEVRQNTAAVRGQTYQALASSATTVLLEFMRDPGLEDLVRRAVTDRESVTDAEWARVETMMLVFLRHVENVHYQVRQRTVDQAELDKWLSDPTFELNLFWTWLDENQSMFRPDFVEYLIGARRRMP